MTAIKSFEKPLTPEEEVYYLNLLKNENNKEDFVYNVTFFSIILYIFYS